MKVICISGHAMHGKDTTAQIMRKMLWGYGKKVLIIHNTDLLKFMCKHYFGWNGEKDDRGHTLLQSIGTDIIRVKKPDFWVNFIADTLEMFNGKWDYVLIPDCRFPNEIEVLRSRGFDVIHVSVFRNGFDNGLTEEQKNHPSEIALDDTAPDVEIDNSGSLVDLTRNLIGFVNSIYEGDDRIFAY